MSSAPGSACESPPPFPFPSSTLQALAAILTFALPSLSRGGEAASEITRRGTGLELKSTSGYHGTPIEGVVNLTPDNGRMLANVSFADGAFVMKGTAAKKAR